MTTFSEEKESLDVEALEEARFVLEIIKKTDPGVYDEMIDNAISLIIKALNFVEEQS